MKEIYLTVSKFARLVDQSTTTIYAMVKEGKLKYKKGTIGRRENALLILESEKDKFKINP